MFIKKFNTKTEAPAYAHSSVRLHGIFYLFKYVTVYLYTIKVIKSSVFSHLLLLIYLQVFINY